MVPEEWRKHLDQVWKNPIVGMDWLHLEESLVNALSPFAALDWETRVRLCREIIDAYTRRGYFKPGDY